MNIAVMSPHCHGNGNTTSAALIAAALAKQNVKVCLTHVKAKSDALYPYYNFSAGAGTTDAVQLTKLIRTGGMQSNNFVNYCKNISEGFDLFSLDTSDTDKSVVISEEEVTDVVDFIAKNAPYDYVVFDVDENSLDKPNVMKVIEDADIVVLILSQAITEISRFKGMKNQFTSRISKLPCIVVVNKYRSTLGNIKDLAKEIEVKHIEHWHALHDNPYVIWCENQGKLAYLTSEIKKNNPDVIELNIDLQKIAQDIIYTKRELSRKRAASRKAKKDEEDY